MTQTAVRILIVDDHPVVREGVALCIATQPDLEVCGEAEDRIRAMEMIAATRPKLAIVDLTLKRSHGMELIKDNISRFLKGEPMLNVVDKVKGY